MKNTITSNSFLFPAVLGRLTNLELAEQVLPYAQEVLSNPQYITNTWNYKNSYGRKPPPSDILNTLSTYIEEVGNNFLKSIGNLEKCGPVNIFFSEMHEGDLHGLHTHPNTMLAGVFYLSIPPGSSNIVFIDPKKSHEFVQYKTDPNNPLSRIGESIIPYTGLFLIWPAWFPHKVEKNNSNKRITCVFNIDRHPSFA